MTDKNNFDAQWKTFVNGVGNDITNELVRVAPVDKGRLKLSINYDVKGDVINISMVDYALYVEFGTPPHIIKPVNKKSLHWKSGGKDVFAKLVRHPGTQPQPFIRNTFHNKLPRILNENVVRYLT